MKLSSDFAFAGFKIIAKMPVTVLLWGLVSTAVSLGATVLMVVMAGPAMMALQAQGETPATDPAEIMAPLAALAPAWLALMVIGLISAAIIQCAVFRSQLRPAEGGLGFMKFGSDEIRQIVVTILYFLAFMVFYILFAVVVGGLVIIVVRPLQDSGLVAGAMIFVIALGAIVAFLYILSRWSLVMVQSYAERKINIFGSLKLTKGSGWSLFGGYFLLGIAMIIAMIIIYSVMFGVMLAAGLSTGGDLMSVFQQMSQPDMSSVAGLFTPAYILQIVIGGLVSGAFYAMIYGAAASAYQTLTANVSKADLF